MVIRFRDYGKRLSDFEQEILARCPQCDAYGGLRLRIANVLTVNSEQSSLRHNGSLASRLPRWLKLTQHREKVLQKIQQLKHRL